MQPSQTARTITDYILMVRPLGLPHALNKVATVRAMEWHAMNEASHSTSCTSPRCQSALGTMSRFGMMFVTSCDRVSSSISYLLLSRRRARRGQPPSKRQRGEQHQHKQREAPPSKLASLPCHVKARPTEGYATLSDLGGYDLCQASTCVHATPQPPAT